MYQIVKDIRYNTTVILENNKRLEKSQEEFTESLAFHVKMVEEVASKNKQLEREVAVIKNQLVEKNEDLAELKTQIERKDEEMLTLRNNVEEVEVKMDDLEQ